MQSEAPGRRQRLRAATQMQHTELDALIERAQHFASLDGYVAWLQGGYSFHRAIEQDLTQRGFGDLLKQTGLTLRAELLRQDLADLGLVPKTAPNAMAPGPCNEAEALGVLYVTEGAALGARVLLLRARSLGLGEHYGARQLTQAAHDLQSWRRFVMLLDGTDCACEDEERVVDAARRTFAVALAHLTQPTSPHRNDRASMTGPQ